jgi:hypothetical protein
VIFIVRGALFFFYYRTASAGRKRFPFADFRRM